MSREEHAREGAQATVGDDEILDVAVVMPRGSTKSRLVGTAIGVGLGGDNAAGWGVLGGMLAQRVESASQGSYPSIVLALSASKLYILGRRRDGLVGAWNDMHLVAHIDREHLQVIHHRSGTIRVIELTDTTTGTTLEFEGAAMGNLGLGEFLTSLDEEDAS